MQEVSLSPHVRGDSWQGLSVEVISDGEPLNLTDASARMQIRRSKGSPTLLMEWTTEDGTITLTEPAEGRLTVAGRVIDLVQGLVSWDLELTLASGRILTVAGGTWLIEGDVSRD